MYRGLHGNATPVERPALAVPLGTVKLDSLKQELATVYGCSMSRMTEFGVHTFTHNLESRICLASNSLRKNVQRCTDCSRATPFIWTSLMSVSPTDP